jgi:hypothetical protein
LLDSFANTVTRARVRIPRARGSLASNAIIAIEALTFTGAAIATALVRAFHVVVSRVGENLQVTILHLRKLFGCSIWIDEVVVNHNLVCVGNSARGIKITLQKRRQIMMVNELVTR